MVVVVALVNLMVYIKMLTSLMPLGVGYIWNWCQETHLRVAAFFKGCHTHKMVSGQQRRKKGREATVKTRRWENSGSQNFFSAAVVVLLDTFSGEELFFYEKVVLTYPCVLVLILHLCTFFSGGKQKEKHQWIFKHLSLKCYFYNQAFSSTLFTHKMHNMRDMYQSNQPYMRWEKLLCERIWHQDIWERERKKSNNTSEMIHQICMNFVLFSRKNCIKEIAFLQHKRGGGKWWLSPVCIKQCSIFLRTKNRPKRSQCFFFKYTDIL